MGQGLSVTFNPRTGFVDGRLCRRLWQIFNKLVKYVGSLWIYEIYVDLLVRGINRVGRYFRSKYILTDVIEKRNAVKRSITLNIVHSDQSSDPL